VHNGRGVMAEVDDVGSEGRVREERVNVGHVRLVVAHLVYLHMMVELVML
jgi:hypothetical protein